MKVVKLRNGYRIRTSESEYQALAHLADIGAAVERDKVASRRGYGMLGQAKAAFNRMIVADNVLTVTEDKSAAADEE